MTQDAPLETAQPAPQRTASQAVIALVDDDRNILTSVSIALQAEGFATRVYSEGEAALKALLENPPHLAVFDIKMPGMDGRAFLVALEEAAPRLVPRVAFLTGDSMGQDVDTFLTASGRPYAEKPLPPVEILALVDNLLEEAGR